MRRGMPLIISAPSGAGKSTLSAMLLKEFPNLRFSVSCTTRPMRNGEIDGHDYFFMDRETFFRHIDNGDFAEWAEVHGNFYGTLLKPAKDTLASGTDMLFDVDVQGAAGLKLAFSKAYFVFILPPSLEILEKRLRERAQDEDEIIRKRLARAKEEIGQSMWYNGIVVNDNLESAYDQLRSLYIAATLLPWANAGHLRRLLEESQGDIFQFMGEQVE